MNSPLIRRFTTLALLAAALPAPAQEATAQRIEITAARHDVRTVCPAIDGQLPVRLARSLPTLDRRALLQVQFQIEGRQIAEVATQGGSIATRAATRRAVAALDCDNGVAGRQVVRFEVLYRLDDAHGDAMAVAAPQSGQRIAAK